MKRSIIIALLASTCVMPASAATFDLSTLNHYVTGSGRSAVDHGYYDGLNGTGNLIFDKSINQKMPWTVGTGGAQASLNFSVPGWGNQGGKTYMSAGDLFPIPSGQSLGQGQSGYSGEFYLNNGFPIWFAFSNPTYDGTIPGCFISCSTITLVPVTLNSFWTTGNVDGVVVTGYSDHGVTVLDTMTLNGHGATGLQQWNFGWAGVDYITMTAGPSAGYYVNDIQVNEPVLSAVPEPSTWAMLLLGFVGLGFGFRQSRRKVSFA